MRWLKQKTKKGKERRSFNITKEGFGTLAKTATVYNDRGQTIPTYPFGGVTEILALASIHLLRLGGLASPDLSCFKLNSFNIQ